MTDENIPQIPEPMTDSKPGGFKAFFSTTVGKLVVIGGAVGALVAVVGIVAFLLLATLVTTNGTTTDAGTPAGSTTGTETPPAAIVETAAPSPVPDIENRDVFTPRNPFQPVLAPASAFRDTEGDSISSSTSGTTLRLVRIIPGSGSTPAKAELTYGGTTYTLAEGEGISGTPWRVYRIGTSSVTMQYGDDTVTMWPGSGVTK